MHSTNYIIRFVLIMTTLAALVLASLNTILGPKHAMNEKIYNKRAILAAVKDHLDGAKLEEMSDKQVEEIFKSSIKQEVLNMSGDVVEGQVAETIDLAKEKKKPESDRLLPLYIYANQAGEQYYIVSVRGSGLWDEIWGSIALEKDLRTVAGASFDHKGETPGLGAEIKDNPAFPDQFPGKKIIDDQGTYTSVIVKKGGATNPVNEVDAISGATVTSNGVTEMLYRGINYYQPYFSKLEKKS
ncbi:MAG: NADH:ubiquinone reductase (Na(+)-transporting) subunit C [Saprospiraceae bacterium]|nr:NADH:ubiquinone reductase (Na(+)-transporting) subunit C [Saprospiraceae bacterium]